MAGATGGDGGGSGDGGTGGTGGNETCPAVAACDGQPPAAGTLRPWRDPLSLVIVASGPPNHRGRDLVLNPGDPQWAIAKFTYGLVDKDLKNEEVDVWLQRDCTGAWEPLGTAITTLEDAHPPVEGVDDSGGRVFLPIPASQALGPGRHRLHFVVAGDGSSTNAILEIVPQGTPWFVIDVDGTLTTTETEEFTDLLVGAIPDLQPDAHAALWALANKGYRPLYLTARPEFLVERTRQFVRMHDLPPGIVHTTQTVTGALGTVAIDYKTAELALLAAKGIVPAWGIGNTDSDAAAYFQGGIAPADRRVFLQYTDAAHGGRRIEGYAELLPELAALDAICP